MLVVCFGLAGPLCAQEREAFKGVDLDGRLIRLGEKSDTKAVVVCFLSTQCPISNGYLPSLNEMASKYRRRGVEFYGVISAPSVTRADAIAHRKSYGIRFPVLFDGSDQLRSCLSPTHTPQAFVLNASGKVFYSGAVDDRHVKLGQKKDSPSQSFLDDAISAVVNDQPVPIRLTKPVGCLMEAPPNRSESGEVTFTRDIAPIIRANCASCHRPSQAAPFSLLTYQDVSSHANQIREVTHSRFMPPWKPEGGFTRLMDELRLTQSELSMIDAWIELGKPKGNPADLPASPKFVKGWQLGTPDVVLEMKDVFKVPAGGPDIRQYFVIPSRLSDNRLISAIEFQPGTPQAIHHASFYIDTKRAARKLDDADPDPGYGGFGGPQIQTHGTLTSWFPGMTPRHLPRGYGRPVPKASDLVAEIHYVPTGKPEFDKSKIGLHFAPRSARQSVVEVQVGTKLINIPPGEERHHIRATYQLPVQTTLLDMVPHMHTLGREVKVWAKARDGSTKPLLWIKDWDFNWQGQYSFARPVRLAEGTTIYVDAWYDNSDQNPLNPNSPPKTVHWGEDSADEMLLCHFQCTCETVSELETLVQHQRQYIADAPGP